MFSADFNVMQVLAREAAAAMRRRVARFAWRCFLRYAADDQLLNALGFLHTQGWPASHAEMP